MPKPDLQYLMYRDPVYTAVTRMIGYQGISLKDAQAQAGGLVKSLSERLPLRKKSEIMQRVLTAVNDLTNPEKRQQEDSRYELTAQARKMASQLLGVPPEHEDFPFYEAQRKRWRKQIEQERKDAEREKLSAENGGDTQETPAEDGRQQPKKRGRKGRAK